MIICRASGNEPSAISTLRTLSTVSEQYRSRFGEYPGAQSGDGLADLANPALQPAPYIDGQIGNGEKNGYRFEYRSTIDAWNCVATPANPQPGVRSFYVDQTGIIREEKDHAANGAATAAHSELGKPFLDRLRWW